MHRAIYVYVDTFYAHDRESDGPVPHDVLMFTATGTQLRAVLDNKLPLNVLTGAKAAMDFEALAERLSEIDDYHWVDFYAGTYVSVGDIDGTALYNNVLSHFEPWLG